MSRCRSCGADPLDKNGIREKYAGRCTSDQLLGEFTSESGWRCTDAGDRARIHRKDGI